MPGQLTARRRNAFMGALAGNCVAQAPWLPCPPLCAIMAVSMTRERISVSSISLNGGCLCGAVRYEVRGEPARFYHCHCRRCRKASGTGHASNIMLKPGEVTWLQGADRRVRYKLPEAERFATCSAACAAVRCRARCRSSGWW